METAEKAEELLRSGQAEIAFGMGTNGRPEVNLVAATRLVLWHRANARRKWRSVATAETSAELTAKMARSGDYITLPEGENPNVGFRHK